MTVKPEHYDVIVKPLITEKATLVSDANAFVFQGDEGREQARHQTGGRGAVQRQGESGQHHDHQRQDQAFPGRPASVRT